MVGYTVYCKPLMVHIETACAIGFGYTRLTSNHKSFPANYSLILHTAKAFLLEQFCYVQYLDGKLYHKI